MELYMYYLEYTGGAHPNTRIKWFNIEEQSGKLLEKADVFAAGKDKEYAPS